MGDERKTVRSVPSMLACGTRPRCLLGGVRAECGSSLAATELSICAPRVPTRREAAQGPTRRSARSGAWQLRASAALTATELPFRASWGVAAALQTAAPAATRLARRRCSGLDGEAQNDAPDRRPSRRPQPTPNGITGAVGSAWSVGHPWPRLVGAPNVGPSKGPEARPIDMSLLGCARAGTAAWSAGAAGDLGRHLRRAVGRARGPLGSR